MKPSPSIWHYVVNIKSTVKILSISVAFLENMNFTDAIAQIGFTNWDGWKKLEYSILRASLVEILPTCLLLCIEAIITAEFATLLRLHCIVLVIIRHHLKVNRSQNSLKTNEWICFSILTTWKYLKLEFGFQVSRIFLPSCQDRKTNLFFCFLGEVIGLFFFVTDVTHSWALEGTNCKIRRFCQG